MDISLAFGEVFDPDANMTNDSIIYGSFPTNKILSIGRVTNESYK